MSEKKEYIERGAFIDFIDAGHLRYATEKVFSENDLVKMISERPAADVEPVIRCKNCEYSGKIDSIFQTWCKKDMRRVNNDFYCAHGKERER